MTDVQQKFDALRQAANAQLGACEALGDALALEGRPDTSPTTCLFAPRSSTWQSLR